MKRTKILALICALAMAVTALVGCGEYEQKENDAQQVDPVKPEDPGQEEKEAKKEIEENVEAFFDAVGEFDGKKAAKYVDKDSDFYEEVINLEEDFEAAMSEGAEAFEGIEEFGIDVDDLIKLILDAITIDGTVNKVTVSDDKATATVTMTMKVPMFDENFTEEMQNVALEKLSIYNTEEEILEHLGEAMLEAFEEVMTTADTQTETVSGDFELEKIDGEWLIVGDGDAEEELFGFGNKVFS